MAIAHSAAVNASFGKYSGYFYALLRIVAGLLLACHGAQKLLGMFGGEGMAQGLFLLGGIIELAGGFLIAFGLFTRPAAFTASGMMAVAYFMMHASGQAIKHVPPTPSEMFFPILNKGELAVVFAFLFLYFAARGAGIWSIDGLFGSRRTVPEEVGGPTRTGRDLI